MPLLTRNETQTDPPLQEKALLVLFSAHHDNTISSLFFYNTRALNDIVREAQAGGASFATIDKLSKDWSEKAGLMRFPEVRVRLGSESRGPGPVARLPYSLCVIVLDQTTASLVQIAKYLRSTTHRIKMDGCCNSAHPSRAKHKTCFPLPVPVVFASGRRNPEYNHLEVPHSPHRAHIHTFVCMLLLSGMAREAIGVKVALD